MLRLSQCSFQAGHFTGSSLVFARGCQLPVERRSRDVPRVRGATFVAAKAIEDARDMALLGLGQRENLLGAWCAFTLGRRGRLGLVENDRVRLNALGCRKSDGGMNRATQLTQVARPAMRE